MSAPLGIVPPLGSAWWDQVPFGGTGFGSVMIVGMLLTGCEGERAAHGPVIRDSSGVAIVESVAPRWGAGEGWWVDSDPLLDLTRTGEGEPHEFHSVRDAVRLRDGSLAVADWGSMEVRFYSPEGTFLHAVGGRGEGPGEFDRLTSVHEVTPDSIVAFDFWQGRLTFLSPRGGVTGTLRPYGAGTRFWRLEVLDARTAFGIAWSFESFTPQPGLYRLPYTVIRLDLGTGAVDTVTALAGAESFSFDEGDAPVPFGRSGHMAVGVGRVFLGQADALEVSVYDGGGRLERVIRAPGFDLTVTAAQVEGERQALAASLGEGVPDRLRQVYWEIPTPATRAAYSDLLVDSDGFVWAPMALGLSEEGDPLDCQIFSPDGEWLGVVRLPPRFRPFQVGRDFVLGVRRDELDVERVQLLQLVRGMAHDP